MNSTSTYVITCVAYHGPAVAGSSAEQYGSGHSGQSPQPNFVQAQHEGHQQQVETQNLLSLIQQRAMLEELQRTSMNSIQAAYIRQEQHQCGRRIIA